jgi:Type IX secretion system protein PorV
MKKVLVTLLVMASMGVGKFAQAATPINNPIITAVPALTITPDSRASGMGDVGTATSPDVNSQFWNPAKYAFMESPFGAGLSYSPWLRRLVPDIYLAYLSGYRKLGERQAISGSVRYFSMGSIQTVDALGINGATVQPNEWAIDLAYSMQLSTKLSAAVTLRYIVTDLGNGSAIGSSGLYYPGSTGAADVSLYYKTPITMESGEGKFGLGLCVSNIGGKVSYDQGQNTNFIPTNMRLGGSFEIPMDAYNRISLSADLSKLLVPTPTSIYGDTTKLNNISSIDGIFQSFKVGPGGMDEKIREISWGGGAEYAYNNQFFVRGGYHHESMYKGNRTFFTAGAGFKLNIFQLDASYIIAVAPSNPLDQTFRFSLSFDMFGLKNLAD